MRLLAKLLGEAFARPDSNREDFASLVLWATDPLAAFSAHEVVRGECARAGFEPEQDDRSRFARALRLAGFESLLLLTRFLTSFENSFSARDRIRTGGPYGTAS